MVELSVGSENLSFTQGPFHYFGVDCLESAVKSAQDYELICDREPFIPDFDLVTKGRVLVLKIRGNQLIKKLNPRVIIL